jgi:hypothetical protein
MVFLLHPKRGPLVGSVLVSPMAGGFWRTEWDIGTIDKDPQLSDRWFCREEYEQKFVDVLQMAADNSNTGCFDIPGATSRWGFAKGMRHKNALELAKQVQALWEEILVGWETRDSDYSI